MKSETFIKAIELNDKISKLKAAVDKIKTPFSSSNLDTFRVKLCQDNEEYALNKDKCNNEFDALAAEFERSAIGIYEKRIKELQNEFDNL